MSKTNSPYVWQKIKIAVDGLGGSATYSEINDFIVSMWGEINVQTLRDQIQVMTVNHKSRIHYTENNKPRLTTIGSPYDYLFTTGRGKVVVYDQEIHGTWEIFRDQNSKLKIRLYDNSAEAIYTPNDILWVKNVTNKYDGQAYLDPIEDEFIMHFPNRHKGNVLSSKVGELILIYQKVNGVPAFTHLVTPKDDELVTDDTRPEYKYGRRVKIIAKTNVLTYIPTASTIWRNISFAGFSQGNTCRIDHITAVKNTDAFAYDVWQRFKQHFIPNQQKSLNFTASVIDEINEEHNSPEVMEGALRLVSHFAKERNRKIIADKKLYATENGTLFCEVCSFSFKTIYDSHFIECHHLTPISVGGVRETTLNDLALVCANCHRMLHMKFDGNYLTPQELQQRMHLLIG
jgi:5-methylcytosine-specific restriction protein A